MSSPHNSPVSDRLSCSRMARNSKPTVVPSPAKLAADSTRCTIPPLHWWRLRPLAEVSQLDVPMLTRCISGFTMLGEPRWRAAETGDVPDAVAVALKLLKTGRFGTPAMDLVGTALLIAAVKGDVTASLIINHLCSLDPNRHRDPGTNELATAVHQLQRLLETSLEVL
jgi:hypothetical protein